MTTTHTFTTNSQRSAIMPAAVVTLLGSFALAALGTVADGDPGDHGWDEFLVICGFSAVAVALVFGLLVHRLQDSQKAGAVGLAIAILSLLTVVVFWVGVTPALAVGGVLLGMAARRTGRGSGAGTAAIAVGALAAVGYVAVYLGDWLSRNNIPGM